MATVRFEKDRYDFYIGGYAPFSSDNNRHDLLFNYINKDLSQLPVLLEGYVSKALDIRSFDLTGYRYSKDDAAQINDILMSLHPYYKFDYEFNHYSTFINAIGEYLNALLINASWKEEDGRFAGFERLYEREWYIKRFSILTEPYLDFFRPDDSSHPQNKFYEKYSYLIGQDCPDDFEVMISIPYWKKNEKGFDHELKTQEFVKRTLFWTMDLSVPYLGRMTVPQRVWLYGNLFGAWHKEYELKVEKRLSLKIPYLYRHGETADKSRISLEMDGLSRQLEALYDSYISNTEISEEAKDALDIAANYAARLASDVVDHEEYEIVDIRELLFLEILHMIECRTQIKRCNNCGLYFVVTNRNQLYCDRPTSDAKQTCAEVGPMRAFSRKKESEPALKKYTKAYNTHRMRVKNKIMTQDDFEAWHKEAKEKLEKVRAGKLDEDEYAKWLKK